MKRIFQEVKPYKPEFPDILSSYLEQIEEAIKKNKHHDYRRHLFLNFLRQGFDVDPVEIVLEEKIKAAEVRGRIDALFRTAIFEFKTNLRIEAPAGIIEIKKYFEAQRNPANYLAILTDGRSFKLFQYENGDPHPIGDFLLSREKPLQAYVSIDQILFSGKPAKPESEDITTRFGPHSAVFNRCRSLLAGLLGKVKGHASVKVKIKEWNVLLSRVYGEELGDNSLFIRHTYLAIFSRLLVAKALFAKEKRRPSDYKGLLTGQFFQKKNLSNVVESDFFSWALGTVVEKDFFGVMAKLEAYLSYYDLSGITGDILKEIYEDLVELDSRHALGEYYTPDWIADRALDLIEYREGVVLDPACGSGSFLLAVIRKLRANGTKGKKLVRSVLASIVGIDVHPLAVMMTKANVLLGISNELATYDDTVFLPIYMADTLLLTEDPKHKTIGVPVSEKQAFHIPLKTILERKDIDQLLDDLTRMAEQAAKGKAFHASAREGLKKRLFAGLSDIEQPYWRQNFELLTKLIRYKRNTVWRFILKNAYKPAYLRNKKVDYIVGNPPWLAYRYIKDKDYRQRVKKLTFDLKLLGKTEVKLFTQMDTSTLFFAYCQKYFLKKGGAIAFVLPKTTMLPAKQHIAFQKMGFSQIHDFSKVTPLFNVRSVLLLRKSDNAVKSKVPVTLYSGVLPVKNMRWKEASFHLATASGTWDFLDSGVQSPHYYSKFFQGATIVPRCFWFVHPDPAATSNPKAPYLETSPEAESEAKEAWKMKIQGRVESQFLYETVLAKGILPFAISRKETVFLPLMKKRDGIHMVDSPALLAEDKPYAAEWMQRVESLWNERGSAEKTPLHAWVNYRNKIITQNIDAPYVVLYNTSGTNLTAALYINRKQTRSEIRANGFVTESVTYCFYPVSEREGDYLCAFLNSNVVNDLIKAFQPQGLWGPRHIHRRPFEVCAIPKFDSNNPKHITLARLGQECRTKMSKIVGQMRGRLGEMRTGARKIIRDDLNKINSLVADLLKEQGQQAKVQSTIDKSAEQSGLFD